MKPMYKYRRNQVQQLTYLIQMKQTVLPRYLQNMSNSIKMTKTHQRSKKETLGILSVIRNETVEEHHRQTRIFEKPWLWLLTRKHIQKQCLLTAQSQQAGLSRED